MEWSMPGVQTVSAGVASVDSTEDEGWLEPSDANQLDTS